MPSLVSVLDRNLKDLVIARQAVVRRKAKKDAKQAAHAERVKKQRQLYWLRNPQYLWGASQQEAEIRHFIRQEFRQAYIGLGTRW